MVIYHHHIHHSEHYYRLDSYRQALIDHNWSKFVCYLVELSVDGKHVFFSQNFVLFLRSYYITAIKVNRYFVFIELNFAACAVVLQKPRVAA